MDLYEAWQRKRFKKLRQSFEPSPAGVKGGKDVRIPPAHIVAEDNMVRAHELRPIGGGTYHQEPPKVSSVAQPVALPAEELGKISLPARPRKGSAGNSVATLRAFANGVTALPSGAREPSSLVRKDGAQRTPIIDCSDETQPQPQDGSESRKTKPAQDPDMEELVGTRHILRDFQDQLQALRAHIALLSTENSDLRQQLSSTELLLRNTSADQAKLAEEISMQQEMLRTTEGDLKLSRNREDRLQRLQESLKQLLAEKEAKLNNTSINSRAVVERTNALKTRIEELEQQLAERQGREAGKSDDSGAELSHEAGFQRQKEPLVDEVQELRDENAALERRLKESEAAANAAVAKAAFGVETASATLEKQQHELQATRHSLDEVRAALAESQAEVQLLKEQQIAADRSAEAAAMAAEGERKAALSQSQSVETRLSEMQLALDSAVAELLPLRRDHQQVVLQVKVLEEEREEAAAADANEAELLSQLEELRASHQLIAARSEEAIAAEAANAAALTKAQATIQALNERLAAAGNAHSASNKRNAALEAAMAVTSAEAFRLREQQAALQADVRQAEEARDAALAARDEFKNKAESECKHLKAQLNQREADSDRLQGQLCAAEAAVAASAGAIATAEKSIAEAQLRADNSAISAKEQEAAMAAMRNELAATEAALADSMQKLALALGAVEDEQAVTRGVLTEAQSRGLLADELRRELAAALAEADHYQQQHAEHARAAEEWDKQAKAFRADLQGEEEARTKAERSAEAASAEVQALKRTSDATAEVLASKSREIEKLQREAEEAKSEALAATEASAGLQLDLLNVHDRLASEVAMAASAADDAEAIRRSLADDLLLLKFQHSEELARLRHDVEHLVEERDALMHENEHRVTSEAASQQTAAAATVSLAEQHGEELRRLQAKHDAEVQLFSTSSRQEAALLSERLVASSSQLAAMTSERDALFTESARAEAAAREHEKQFEQLEREAHELRQAKDAAVLLAATAESTAATHQHRIEQLQEKLQSLGMQEKQLQRDLEAAEASRLAASQVASERARQLDALAAEHVDLSESLHGALSEVAELKEALATKQAEAAEAAAAVEALSTDLAERAVEASASSEHTRELRAALDATHETHGRTLADIQAVMHEMREAPDKDYGALSFELWRLIEENDMLRARNQEYETDVKELVENSQALGHANPKQKLQYHLRWKRDMESLKSECTLLLRERFQLEQCIRYLAVRCGLSIAVERDVTSSRERTPLDKLQPASLVPHYKFSSRLTHVTDAAGDHVALEDIAGEAAEKDSQEASDKGSISTVFSSRPADHAAEQQILTRVAFVCNPPPAKAHEQSTRPTLTSALLASRNGSKDSSSRPLKLPPAALSSPPSSGRQDISAAEPVTPPASSSGSFSDTGPHADETRSRASTGSDRGERRRRVHASTTSGASQNY